MMDYDSAQIREVYAHYGLAMYCAQVLEREAWDALCLIEHGNPSVITRWRFEEAQEEAARFTMGKVVKELNQSGELPPHLEEILTEAVKKRNWLAHWYFWDRCVELKNARSRESMIEELYELSVWFQEVDKDLSAARRRIMRERGIAVPEDLVALQQAELLSGHASPVSTRRKLNKTERLVKIYRYNHVDDATGTSAIFPLFQLEDGTFCSLCDCGLTYGPEAVAPNCLIPLDEFDDLLPAQVTIKPRGASSWHFRIPLGEAGAICVEPVATRDGVVHRWYIQRSSR